MRNQKNQEKNLRDNLLLVNRKHAYPADIMQDLIPVCPERYPGILLERETAHAFCGLMGECDGWNWILPVSGWRSQEEQERIYADSIQNHGYEFTEKYVAKPGHSEHQTGLAIDVGLIQPEIDFIRPAFPEHHAICQKFRALASSWGFIERYPADKEKITEIAYEPWHFRYVGIIHAEKITQLGLTLEEYLGES